VGVTFQDVEKVSGYQYAFTGVPVNRDMTKITIFTLVFKARGFERIFLRFLLRRQYLSILADSSGLKIEGSATTTNIGLQKAN